MEETPKPEPESETRIRLSTSTDQPIFPLDSLENFFDDRKTPFFKSRSRRRRADTWVISVFVIVHLIFFLITLFVNNCWTNSHGDCAVKAFGRMSFQPISENPFLGPSFSTFDRVGALRRTLLAEHQYFRLLSSPWLHAGFIHLIINQLGVIFIGIYLEREFGSCRIGAIYILSAYFGTLMAALFVRDRPEVSSSGALFGLLGATLSALTRNWEFYTKKTSALLILLTVAFCNFMLGLLPYIDNYANIGGLVSGVLLGFVLLSSTQLKKLAENNKPGLYEYNIKNFLNWKLKLDRPVLRIVSLLLFSLLFGALLATVLLGINIGSYCKFCRYMDCIPSKRWSCNELTTSCESMVSGRAELTLTCMRNGQFRVLPFTNISEARAADLCTLICS